MFRDFPFRLLLYQTLLPKHLNPGNKISLGKREMRGPLLKSSLTKNLFPSIACYQARSMLAIAGVVCLQSFKLLLVCKIILLGSNILEYRKCIKHSLSGPKSAFLVILGQILPFFAHFVQCLTKKQCEQGVFSIMWVTKLLISPIKRRIFCWGWNAKYQLKSQIHSIFRWGPNESTLLSYSCFISLGYMEFWLLCNFYLQYCVAASSNKFSFNDTVQIMYVK